MSKPHRPPRIGAGLAIAAAFSLSACGLGDALGLNKRAPDEFAVVKREPLIVPPEHDLRPPRPGAPRPQVGTPGDQVRATLTGRPVEQVLRERQAAENRSGTSGTEGEKALLARTRTASDEPGIGAGAGDDGLPVRDQIVADGPARARVDASLFSRVLNWQPEASGEPVDAARQARRVFRAPQQEPVAEGGGGPEIIRHEQTPLDDLEEDLF